MNYLKIKNTPLALLREDKYNDGHGIGNAEPKWQRFGFKEIALKIKSLQYTDAKGDRVQVLPISVKGLFNKKLLPHLIEDCLEYELPAPEVIDEAAYQAEKILCAEARAAAKANR